MSFPSLSPSQRTFLKHLGVVALYLFGSRSQKNEGPLSDYDYGVLFPQRGMARSDKVYDSLYNLLSDISPRNLETDIIDIVFLQDAGLEICFHVIRYGIILYENTPPVRLQFENRIGLLYCDFFPVLNQFDQAILKAI